jgi:endonuclease/exonuclease/phosphatase (EEP) superfamily protein YafD
MLLAISALAYAICAALFAFSLMRLTANESSLALALYGLTPWLYLPVYVAVGFALRASKPILLSVSVALALVHLVTIWPDIKPPDRISSSTKDSPRLRVFSSNLYFANEDLTGIVDEIRANDPDVVVFQETTRPHRARLLREPALTEYSHRVAADNSDTMVLSRVPIESSDIWTAPARPMARARLSTPIGVVELIAVHTVAPIGDSAIQRWKQMLRALHDLAEQRDTPMLMVGDFNATIYHPRFDDLLDTGLTDAHSARGKGFTGTWPRDRKFPPLLRIDHALSSDELVPVSASYGTGTGSDHRPIVVEYALVGGGA